MKGELLAIIEKAPEGGFWAICPEVPGANGQDRNYRRGQRKFARSCCLDFRGSHRGY